MGCNRGYLAASILLLATLSLTGIQARALSPLNGPLVAPDGLDISGTTTASTTDGTINVHSNAIQTASLTAEKADIRIEWERGTYLQSKQGDAEVRRYQALGLDWHNFSSAEIHFSPFNHVQQLLTLPSSAQTSIHDQSAENLQLSSVENKTIANHWDYNQSEPSTVRAIGFWHILKEPHVSIPDGDEAKVTGNFTLFVNNVTIQITDSEEGTWQNWTGYQVSNPDSPAGPLENPAAKEYDVRATTLHVTNGTLWVNATDAVDLYAKNASATVDGSVYAPRVSGKLLSDALRYAYDGNPLLLSGQGSLDLGLASESADPGPPSPSTVPPLTLAPSGGFDVQQTRGLQVSETTSAWNPLSWFDGWVWFGLGLLAASAVSAVAGASRPVHVHRGIATAFGAWRGHRYKRWVHEGELLSKDGAYEEACEFFSRARQFDPTRPRAYVGMMVAHTRLENPSTVLDIADQARQHVDRDRLPPRFAQKWLYNAMQLDASEHVVEAWLLLAEQDPHEALIVYATNDHPALRDERVDARVEELEERLSAVDPRIAAAIRDVQASHAGDDRDEGGGDAPAGPEVA